MVMFNSLDSFFLQVVIGAHDSKVLNVTAISAAEDMWPISMRHLSEDLPIFAFKYLQSVSTEGGGLICTVV